VLASSSRRRAAGRPRPERPYTKAVGDASRRSTPGVAARRGWV